MKRELEAIKIGEEIYYNEGISLSRVKDWILS